MVTVRSRRDGGCLIADSLVFRIEGDKVAEEHLYFDQVKVLTQLGLMPAAATA